jgi:DNA-binding SARP family transcriptional activator
MEYRVLGPLEVVDGDGRRIPLGGARQQTVLFSLLLRAGRTVTLERLVDELWDEPPATAARTVQAYVSRLRRELPEGTIETRPGGYAFSLNADELDLHAFDQTADEGRTALAAEQYERAAQLFGEALALWRGPALAGLVSEALRREADRLEELRLQVLENRIEADLGRGRHRELVPELQALVAEHSFRERPRAQLMLALYRSGRPSDALELYRKTRRLLVEELGMEPGPELRELEQAILRQDPSLAPPAAPKRTAARPTRRPRRAVVLVVAACATGAAALLGVLLPQLLEGKAAAVFQPGTILIDMKTRKQIKLLPPAQLASPKFPVFSGGHVWLFNASPRSFVQLDPATGTMLTQFDPPDGMADLPTSTPYAVDGRTLWVGAGDDLVKFDIPLKEEVDRFHLDEIVGQRGSTEGVAVGGGLVWVGRDVGLGQVVAVDPATGKLRHRFGNITHHANVTYGGGRVWTASASGVTVIDPSTNDVHDVPELETTDLYFGPASGDNVVAFGGGFGWTTDALKGVVYKIHPSGRIVDRHYTGPGVTGAFFSGGVLWVRNEDDGTVTGIDAITRERTVYRFGRLVAAEVVGAGVLVAALQPATKDVVAAVKGKVVRLFSQRDSFVEKSEPALEWNLAAAQIEFATCANLLNYPDKPAPAGLQPQPEVAAAMPVLSRDKRTYTFKVRRGYKFAPPWNEPLTAETFRESIERALSPKLESLTQRLRGSDYPMPGPDALRNIQGEQAFRKGKARHISGLRANGQRLSIRLTRPSPGFVYQFAGPGPFCPVPTGTPAIPGAANHRLGKLDDFSMPSAGPYYVANWRKGHYVILKRNPNYHGPRPQRLDAIVLREDMDAAEAVDLVRDGSWDGIISSGDVGAEHLDPLLNPDGAIATRYGGRGSAGLKYNPGRNFQTGYLALNASRPPFSDRTVRRAAAFAVNRGKLASVWQQVPTDQLLPPDSAGFRDHRFYPLRRPNLEKAKALMRGRRFSAVMTIQPGCAPCVEEGQLVQAELGQIGIRVRLDPGRDVEASDIADSGLYGGRDNAAFLHDLFAVGVATSWPPRGVVQAVERVNRLYGRKRQSAAAALANWLTVNVVPVIPDGNHVQGELFGPRVGCRIFPPGGVDLAALCRK